VTRVFKKPDLTAPRYRPKKLNLTNIDSYRKFVEENPRYANITLEKFKEVISLFNGKIWQTVIDERDGVELPEQLGYIFIGSCGRKKSNVDFNKSREHGVIIQHQNWDSDQYMAKIFYTNFETKYRFKHNDMWSFVGIRDFKRTVGKTYPEEWKKYVVVDDLVRVSKVFRIQKYKDYKKQEVVKLLDEYDEFNLE
jgi:hypothetical protein